MKVAIVGVTGMVGRVLCRVLEERQFPITEFMPVASARSVGQLVEFNGQQHVVMGMEEAIAKAPDLAIFSAGGDTAKMFAPRFAAQGTTVVDNSSAFRMDADKPLIVPEVNLDALNSSDRIIANPNCSTIQLVVALKPLHDAFGIDRLVISTYQSMTGTGVKAVRQYEEEAQGNTAEAPAYPHPIFENCLPHCDVFFENGYTREELKLVHETRKILGDEQLRITATAVRVPVKGGHSESVNVSFKEDFEINQVRQLLSNAPGIVLMDAPGANDYPTPLQAADQDAVFVGRLRRDHSNEKTLNLWVVADNLRKGAATNTVQIAEYLLAQAWLPKPASTLASSELEQG
jgi:aspartate-semialdehyde dehydrogenase